MGMNMLQIAQSAIDQLPPACRFTAEDAAAIRQHQEFLAALESQLVRQFYDTVFEHPPTAEVFFEGERPAREATLTGWWRRTVSGPLDDDYFAWMASAGMAHVFRGVSNPMMLGMVNMVATYVADQVMQSALPQADAVRLSQAFKRLSGTIAVVITHGYDRSMSAALSLARVRSITRPSSTAAPDKAWDPV